MPQACRAGSVLELRMTRLGDGDAGHVSPLGGDRVARASDGAAQHVEADAKVADAAGSHGGDTGPEGHAE